MNPPAHHVAKRRTNTSHWTFVVLLIIASIPIHVHAFSTCRASVVRQDAIIRSALFSETEETTMPPRKARHNRRRSRTSSSSSSMTEEEEMVQHVTAQYISGGRSTFAKYHNKGQQQDEDEHAATMKRLDRHPALVLNADYQPISFLPLSMWHWQEAVKAVFSGKVTVVEVYPDVMIRAANIEIPLPSVIALNEYVPQPNNKPAFTKRNVFLRDEYRCQYCKNRFHTCDLSLDHVKPRCMGGRLIWENAVTSCLKCNGRKGSLTVNQLKSVGMKLNREPVTPTQYQLHKIAGRMLPAKRVHPAWMPYLGAARTMGGIVEELSLEDIP